MIIDPTGSMVQVTFNFTQILFVPIPVILVILMFEMLMGPFLPADRKTNRIWIENTFEPILPLLPQVFKIRSQCGFTVMRNNRTVSPEWYFFGM